MDKNNSLNPTLNYLRYANLAREWATVAQDYSGDYDNVNDAVDAGHKLIYVKAGTYVLTANLVLDGQSLFGESPKNTIIQVPDNFHIEMRNHTAADAYDLQQMQLLNNDTQVNGIGGTAWASGGNPPSGYTDPWFLHELNGVQDVETIPLDALARLHEQYRGLTQQDNYYLVDMFNHGSYFTGFTIESTKVAVAGILFYVSDMFNQISNNYFKAQRTLTTACLYLGNNPSCAHNNLIFNNLFLSGEYAIRLEDATNNRIFDNYFGNQNTTSIDTTPGTTIESHFNRFENNVFHGFTTYGIHIGGFCNDLTINSNLFRLGASGQPAIRFQGECNHVIITNNRFHTPTSGNAILGTAVDTSGNWVIANNHFGEAGIELPLLSIILVANNTFGDDITLTGTHVSVISNYIASGLTTLGFRCSFISNHCPTSRVTTTGDGSIISNNAFWNPAAVAVSVGSPHCSVTGNTFHEVGVGINAISLTGAADYTVVSGNNIDGGLNGITVSANAISLTITNNHILTPANNGISMADSNHYTTIAHNYIANSTASAIRTNDLNYSTFIGNTLLNSGSAGIQLNALANPSNFLIISNNLIYDSASHAIVGDNVNSSIFSANLINDCVGSAVYIVNGANISLTGNYCQLCGDLGLRLEFTSGPSIIENNFIYDCQEDGILVDSATGSGYLIVSGNRIYDCGGDGAHGIHLFSNSSHAVVSHNLIYSIQNDGIRVETGDSNARCVISNNAIYDADDSGIILIGEGGAHTVNDENAIVGNSIYSCAYGISSQTQHNLINSNVIVSSTNESIIAYDPHNIINANRIAGGGDSISLTDADHCVISDNLMSDMTGHGLDINNVDHCIISGNLIDNPSSEAISLDACTYCVVSGNEIDSPGSNAIWIDTSASYMAISNNMIRGVTGSGISTDSDVGTQLLISGNHIKTCTASAIYLSLADGHCLVTSNWIESVSAYGVYLQSNSTGYCSVCTNMIHDPDDAVEISTTCFSTICNSNHIFSPAGYGVRVTTTATDARAIVNDNMIFSSSTNAIRFENSGDENRGIVCGNFCHNPAWHGIYIQANQVIIGHNVVDNGSGASDGISVTGDKCIINGCRCENNAADGVDISNTDRCIVTSCILLGNAAQLNQAGATNQVVANNIVA